MRRGAQRRTRRRRQQAGVSSRAKLVAMGLGALATLQGSTATQTPEFQDLVSKWWNEGGIANSQALANAIVNVFETKGLSVDTIVQELVKEQKEQDHTIHTILSSPPSVAPAELPEYVAYPANALKPGWTVRDQEGRVLRIGSVKPLQSDLYGAPTTELRWTDVETDEEEQGDVESTTPFEVLAKPEGGKRRRRNKKTLRRKK